MNKIISKVAQGFLMAFFGYEVGQNQIQNEPVVVKLEKKDIENHSTDTESNRDLIIILVVALLAFMIVIILMLFRYREKKPRATTSLRV